ncbi:MAG: hypothetical protein IKD76_02940 [Clostridia bacterium]|nr:hypothetical protein [Clostridia bacterium]
MYRIFCESYENFIKTFEDENYRLNIAKPFELIVDTEKFKAFLWTLTSRNIVAEESDVETNDDLEEQAKLVNSFLKLAYWY